MTVELTAAQKKVFTEAFSLFDKDGDSKINSKELGSVMRSLGLSPTDQDLLNMINEVDADVSGTIELPEFLILMAKHAIDDEDEMKEVFKIFDVSGVGYITKAELRYVMASLGEKLTDSELEEMIAAADTSGTGKVSYDDFVTMVTTK